MRIMSIAPMNYNQKSNVKNNQTTFGAATKTIDYEKLIGRIGVLKPGSGNTPDFPLGFKKILNLIEDNTNFKKAVEEASEDVTIDARRNRVNVRDFNIVVTKKGVPSTKREEIGLSMSKKDCDETANALAKHINGFNN